MKEIFNDGGDEIIIIVILFFVVLFLAVYFDPLKLKI